MYNSMCQAKTRNISVYRPSAFLFRILATSTPHTGDRVRDTRTKGREECSEENFLFLCLTVTILSLSYHNVMNLCLESKD